MISFIYGNSESPEDNQVIADFVSELIWGHAGGFKDFGSVGILDDGVLIAGIVYYDWDPESQVIQISSASTSKRWLTRRVIHRMFEVPFNQLGCQMVVLRVSSKNEVMCSIARRYGFSEYLIPRLGGRSDDQILFTLTDDVWRSKSYSIGGMNGKEERAIGA